MGGIGERTSNSAVDIIISGPAVLVDTVTADPVDTILLSDPVSDPINSVQQSIITTVVIETHAHAYAQDP